MNRLEIDALSDKAKPVYCPTILLMQYVACSYVSLVPRLFNVALIGEPGDKATGMWQ